jgi:hypothetical protein
MMTMSRSEQRIGKAGEDWAANAVRGLGVEMVEEIGTPVKIVRTKKLYDGTWCKIVWGEKVSGDTRGVLPGGRSVLVETKTILDRNLQWGDLRPHQPGRLSQHAELGGLSLLVWVHASGIFVMQWPISDFCRGKSITPERAQTLQIEV